MKKNKKQEQLREEFGKFAGSSKRAVMTRSMIEEYWNWIEKALAQKEAEVLGRVGKDTERLDFLDRQNQILNEFHKTEYGWELIINNNVNRLMAGNVNRVDLNDSKAHGVKSCREAIDEKMNQLKTK